MDLKDKQILYQLDLGARQSNTQIGKKVGLSKDVVNYRIKNLEKDVIKGYYTVIDTAKLGYFSFRVYIKFLDVNPEKEKEILDYLVKDKQTFFVINIDGVFDVGFGVWVKDIYEFENFYNNFKKKYVQFIGKESISMFTSYYISNRSYILDKKVENIIEYGKHKSLKYDNVDLEILNLISSNARIPVIEISRKLNIPERTIAFRIRRLEKNKIIQGYRALLNLELLNYKYYKVDFKLKSILKLKEMISYAKIHPNIVYVNQTIAGSDFEFDLEVEGKKQFLRVIDDLRGKFPEIREWNYFTVRNYNKLIYFPQNNVDSQN